MEFDSTPVVVYGIKLANKGVAKLVRRVLLVSFLAAAVVIALTVLNFTLLRDRNTAVQSVLTCVVGLIIPFMGWMGAKTNNRNMVGMFCAFSFSCGLFNLISYAVVMVSIAAVKSIIADCSEDGTVVIDGETNTTICTDYTDESLRNMYVIATCVTIPVVVLQCVGAYFGNHLYAKLTPGVILTYNADPYPRGGFGGQVYGMEGGGIVRATPSPGIVTVPYPNPVTVIPAQAVTVDSPIRVYTQNLH